MPPRAAPGRVTLGSGPRLLAVPPDSARSTMRNPLINSAGLLCALAPLAVAQGIGAPTEISGNVLWLDGADVNGDGVPGGGFAGGTTWVDRSSAGSADCSASKARMSPRRAARAGASKGESCPPTPLIWLSMSHNQNESDFLQDSESCGEAPDPNPRHGIICDLIICSGGNLGDPDS